MELLVYVFQLSEEGAADADEGEDGVSSYREYELPAREFHGLWDSLIYSGDIKQRLLTYAGTALFFSDRKVDTQLVSFNRTALLHGPPGTGKTSMWATAHALQLIQVKWEACIVVIWAMWLSQHHACMHSCNVQSTQATDVSHSLSDAWLCLGRCKALAQHLSIRFQHRCVGLHQVAACHPPEGFVSPSCWPLLASTSAHAPHAPYQMQLPQQ